MISLIALALLVVPLLEIAMFIIIGGQIGVVATLAMIFFTAVIGSILLRVQGFGLIRRIQGILDAGGIPDRELVHGVMILIAGVLLLTPGFVTDTLGFLLFIPAVRDAGWNILRSRIAVHGRFSGREWKAPERGGGRTIDLDESEFSADENPHSPWKGGPDNKRRD